MTQQVQQNSEFHRWGYVIYRDIASDYLYLFQPTP